MQTTRRKTLLGAALALATLALPALAQDAKLPAIRIGTLENGTVNWEIQTIRNAGLDRKNGFELVPMVLAGNPATQIAMQGGEVDTIVSDWLWVAQQRAKGTDFTFLPYSTAVGGVMVPGDSPAKTLADLTTSLRGGMTQSAANDHLTRARAMATSLQEAHAALQQAETSLRFNRLARNQHAALSELNIRSTALEHSAIQLRVMCRSIQTAFLDGASDWMAPDQFGRDLADLFGRNTVLVRYVGGDRLGVRPDVPSTDELRRAMQAYWRDRDDKGWLYAGEILTVAERMARELDDAIEQSIERPRTLQMFP